MGGLYRLSGIYLHGLYYIDKLFGVKRYYGMYRLGQFHFRTTCKDLAAMNPYDYFLIISIATPISILPAIYETVPV